MLIKNVTIGGVKPLTVRCYGQIMGQYHSEAGVSIIKSKSKNVQKRYDEYFRLWNVIDKL